MRFWAVPRVRLPASRTDDQRALGGVGKSVSTSRPEGARDTLDPDNLRRESPQEGASGSDSTSSRSAMRARSRSLSSRRVNCGAEGATALP